MAAIELVSPEAAQRADPERTRVELEHRNLDRYGLRRDEMRAIFDKGGDRGRLLATFADVAAAVARPSDLSRP